MIEIILPFEIPNFFSDPISIKTSGLDYYNAVVLSIGLITSSCLSIKTYKALVHDAEHRTAQMYMWHKQEFIETCDSLLYFSDVNKNYLYSYLFPKNCLSLFETDCKNRSCFKRISSLYISCLEEFLRFSIYGLSQDYDARKIYMDKLITETEKNIRQIYNFARLSFRIEKEIFNKSLYGALSHAYALTVDIEQVANFCNLEFYNSDDELLIPKAFALAKKFDTLNYALNIEVEQPTVEKCKEFLLNYLIYFCGAEIENPLSRENIKNLIEKSVSNSQSNQSFNALLSIKKDYNLEVCDSTLQSLCRATVEICNELESMTRHIQTFEDYKSIVLRIAGELLHKC